MAQWTPSQKCLITILCIHNLPDFARLRQMSHVKLTIISSVINRRYENPEHLISNATQKHKRERRLCCDHKCHCYFLIITHLSFDPHNFFFHAMDISSVCVRAEFKGRCFILPTSQKEKKFPPNKHFKLNNCLICHAPAFTFVLYMSLLLHAVLFQTVFFVVARVGSCQHSCATEQAINNRSEKHKPFLLIIIAVRSFFCRKILFGCDLLIVVVPFVHLMPRCNGASLRITRMIVCAATN